MARIFVTGAETGDLSPWTNARNASVVAAKSGMTGSYCLDVRSNAINSSLTKNLGVTCTEIYLYALIRREGSTTYDGSMFYFWAADKGEAGFFHVDTTNYYVQCSVSWGGTNYANSGPTTIAVNTTYRFEMYFKPSTGSDGRCVVKINGTTVIDFTGITSNKTNVRYLSLGNTRYQAYSAALFYYDDIIVDDANWITGDGEQPHKISGLAPVGAGAESDLVVCPPENIEADMARWLFESADLGQDENANADLTLYNSPTAETGDYRQGSSSIKLVRSSNQYGKVLTANVPSGFPLKTGETNRVFTLCFWMKPDTLPGASVYHNIFTKHLASTDTGYELQLTNSKLKMNWGYGSNSVSAWEILTLTADKWYFVAIRHDGDNRTREARIYDYDAGTWTTYTGSQPTGVLRICSRDYYIGSYDGGTNCFDGLLDDMRIYPCLLSNSVIDLIMQGKSVYDPYDAVKSVPPADNIYIRGSGDGDIHTFAMANLVGSVESIKCVQLCLRNYLTGTPTAVKTTPVVRLGGTNYLGSALQSPYKVRPEGHVKLWALNPATSAAWVKSEVNEMECGVKLTTS